MTIRLEVNEPDENETHSFTVVANDPVRVEVHTDKLGRTHAMVYLGTDRERLIGAYSGIAGNAGWVHPGSEATQSP